MRTRPDKETNRAAPLHKFQSMPELIVIGNGREKPPVEFESIQFAEQPVPIDKPAHNPWPDAVSDPDGEV